MSEYTSLEVSKRLSAAGFKAEDKHLAAMVEDGKGGAADVWAYRADTLLAWLMKQDAGKVAEAMGLRTLCENGRYGYVQIDVLDNGEWNVSLFRPIEVRVTAPTLADALGETVIQVLEVNK